MEKYDIKTYMKEERIHRAQELTDAMEDMVRYHYDEIASDEPYCVRVLTMRTLAQRLLAAANE